MTTPATRAVASLTAAALIAAAITWTRPVHVHVVQAGICAGTLIVTADLERPARRVWAPVHHDGTMRLQARQAGRWRPVATAPGGEGALRVADAAAAGLTPLDTQVRVTWHGWTSSPALIHEGCPV